MSKKAKPQEAALIQPIQPTEITEETVLAEALALGPDFLRVKVSADDLVAETEELSQARGDVKELAARGFPVTFEMFDRIQIIANMLAPGAATRSLVRDERKAKTRTANDARARLIAIRERLGLLGAAAGIDRRQLRIKTRGAEKVGERMREMIDVVQKSRARFSDLATLDSLIAEATLLIDQEKASRLAGGRLSDRSEATTRRIGQLKRLLFDQLHHISRQGLAAFPDDPSRDRWYRFERFVSKPSKKKLTAPDGIAA